MTADEPFPAIDAGDEAAVVAALAADPSLAGARDHDGVSATMHALYHGRPAIAERLGAIAERLGAIAERLGAALPALGVFEAAALGRLDRVLELVGAEPDLVLERSPDGFTALYYPAFFGLGDAAGVARVLLEAGADVNARSANDCSVLPLRSAVAGNHREVAALLIDAGADVNARQRHGWTPLHGAAQNGAAENGAAENGAAETVERLLAAGADRSVTNDDDVSAADVAAAAGHAELAARLRG